VCSLSFSVIFSRLTCQAVLSSEARWPDEVWVVLETCLMGIHRFSLAGVPEALLLEEDNL